MLKRDTKVDVNGNNRYKLNAETDMKRNVDSNNEY